MMLINNGWVTGHLHTNRHINVVVLKTLLAKNTPCPKIDQSISVLVISFV